MAQCVAFAYFIRHYKEVHTNYMTSLTKVSPGLFYQLAHGSFGDHADIKLFIDMK